MKFSMIITVALSALLSSNAFAQDKSQYSLFNPTPHDQMREFDSDRPGAGDSAKTVDAGHYRVESALFEYGRPTPDTETYGINSFYIIAGLTNSTELQLGWDTYLKQRTGSLSEDGVGDTTLRYKWNITGNDKGEIALGVIPYLVFPTSTNDMGNSRIAGGVNAPFSIEINDKWSFSSTPAISIEPTENSEKNHAQFQMTMGLQNEWSDQWAGFIELVSLSSEQSKQGVWQAGTEFGITFHPARDLQFDISAHIGITDADDDFSSAFGFTYRI